MALDGALASYGVAKPLLQRLSSYETTVLPQSSCNNSLAGQKNMRGLDDSTDLEMEFAETDEVMVRQIYY